MQPYGDHVTTSVILVCDSGVTVMPSRAIGLTLMVFTSRRVVRSLPSHASFAKGSFRLLSLVMIGRSTTRGQACPQRPRRRAVMKPTLFLMTFSYR
jgi:hypothetical protein